jgi:GDP-L-fucose synthase
VVLAAATVGGIQANNTRPADFLLQNLQIQTNVIETAWRYGVRRLLFLGSSCIYPKFSEQPIREESLLNGSLEPTNEWYAIAKIAGIKLGEALRLQHGFDAISLMPTNLYGPGDNYDPTGSHVLPAMIRRFQVATDQNLDMVTCWGSGTPLREFLHADDLGSACLFALENWDPSHPSAPKDDQGKPLAFLNVGTGFDLSIKELAEHIARIVGYKGSIQWDATKPDGTPKKQLNVSRLSNMGWTPKISLEQGLPMAVEDFKWRRTTGLLRG